MPASGKSNKWDDHLHAQIARYVAAQRDNVREVLLVSKSEIQKAASREIYREVILQGTLQRQMVSSRHPGAHHRERQQHKTICVEGLILCFHYIQLTSSMAI
jgi:hypothetical protein